MANILLVEDSSVDAKTVREAVSEVNNDIDFHHVTLLKDAMAKLSSESINLILLDLNLPDSKGADTFVRIFSKYKKIPLIILTGMEHDKLAQKLIKIGAKDYIPKSKASIETLRSSIQKCLSEHSATSKPKVLSPEPKLETRESSNIVEERSAAPLGRPSSLSSVSSEVKQAEYKVTAKKYHKTMISQTLPEIFEELVEQYTALIIKSMFKDEREIKANFSTYLKTQIEAMEMLNLSAADILNVGLSAQQQLLCQNYKLEDVIKTNRCGMQEYAGFVLDRLYTRLEA